MKNVSSRTEKPKRWTLDMVLLTLSLVVFLVIVLYMRAVHKVPPLFTVMIVGSTLAAAGILALLIKFIFGGRTAEDEEKERLARARAAQEAVDARQEELERAVYDAVLKP